MAESDRKTSRQQPTQDRKPAPRIKPCLAALAGDQKNQNEGKSQGDEGDSR